MGGTPEWGGSFSEASGVARRRMRDARLFALPSAYSFTARRIQASKREGTMRIPAFEIWEYQAGGRSLFPNRYAGTASELRFNFVYRPERGGYQLQEAPAVR